MSSIHKKISEIQMKLLKEEFGTKNGYRSKYIPLPEMLPKIIHECYNQELTLYFSATTEHLILKLHTWKDNEEFSARVRLPELTKNEQDEGKKITYLKRYLLMNTFMILEDSVDPDDYDTSASPAPSSAPTNNKSSGINRVIEKTVELLQAKGLHEDEITPRAIYNAVNSNKELPQSVKTNMLDWYKGFTKEEKTSVYVGASA